MGLDEIYFDSLCISSYICFFNIIYDYVFEGIRKKNGWGGRERVELIVLIVKFYIYIIYMFDYEVEGVGKVEIYFDSE